MKEDVRSCCLCFAKIVANRIMASYNMFDDEDYDEIFLTQSGDGDKCVSLEEDMEYKTVHDPQYSDILDNDEEKRDIRLRCVVLGCQ